MTSPAASLPQVVIQLPGVVIARSKRYLRLDATNASSDEWSHAMAWVNSHVPAEAAADLFSRDDREVWIFTW